MDSGPSGPPALQRVGRFVQSLYDPRTSGFRFTPDGQATVLSTAFALQSLCLIGDTEGPRVTAAAERLRACQRPDGLFVDPLFAVADTERTHTEAYIQWQTSFFALAALDWLGRAPRHGLEFISPMCEPDTVRAWLAERNLTRFWYVSNQIMFLLYFLTFRAVREGDPRAAEALQLVLERLDAMQNPETGFWGTRGLHDQMYGAAHIYMFYDYFGRPVPQAERIIDNTLALQHASGLFGSAEGGACEDYDGVEILWKLSQQTDHRAPEVAAALERLRSAVLATQHPDGGFAYRARQPDLGSALKRLFRSRQYAYSGWRLMRADRYEPDAWGTFFRALALAAIDHQRDGTAPPGGFYALPGWGYAGRRAPSAGPHTGQPG